MSLQLLLASSSRCHPFDYLDHCEPEMRTLFAGAKQILFVPYARPGGRSHDDYTTTAKARFEQMGLALQGVHEFPDARAAITAADGVFIGGGNTFVLLRTLYTLGLLDALRNRIVNGMPYMGTSAGSNVAGLSIGTSNDMPIVHPDSFDALGVVPYNLNPHFPHATPDPTHHGETREDRISEFHVFNSQPVVALHEDGMLRVDGTRTTLLGNRNALVFRAERIAKTISPGPVDDDDLRP